MQAGEYEPLAPLLFRRLRAWAVSRREAEFIDDEWYILWLLRHNREAP